MCCTAAVRSVPALYDVTWFTEPTRSVLTLSALGTLQQEQNEANRYHWVVASFMLFCLLNYYYCYYYYNHFTAPGLCLSGTTRVSRYQKCKTYLDLLEQQIVSGSSISWAICKSVCLTTSTNNSE